jgi:hypothetical protein
MRRSMGLAERIPMTAELFAILVAIAVPVITLLALGGLFAGLGALERVRDELIELGSSRR